MIVCPVLLKIAELRIAEKVFFLTSCQFPDKNNLSNKQLLSGIFSFI